MYLENDEHEIPEPEPESEPESESPVGGPSGPNVGAEAFGPTEAADPDAQPNDYDGLEVVTTSPEDGRSKPGRAQRQRSYNSRPGGLSADDPFWTFGTPPESWGSSVKKPGGPGTDAHQRRPRMYFECRSCGVKVEKKRAHGRGKVPCPMCGRWMNLSHQG